MTAAQRPDWNLEGLDGSSMKIKMKDKDKEKSGSSWLSYVMRPKSRNRSHNRYINTNNTITASRQPPPWPDQAQRPATAVATPYPPDGLDQALRPTRSRSRLRKPQPDRLLKTSASASAIMVQSTPNQPPQTLYLDQQDLTALPQLPEQVIPHRSSSLQKPSRPRTADRPRGGKDTSKYFNPVKSTLTAHPVLPSRPKTSPSELTSKRDLSGARSLSPPNTSPSPPQPPRIRRHQPLAPYDPFPLNPVYYTTTPDMGTPNTASAPPSASQGTAPANDQTLLPDGFKPGVSAHTQVETAVRPAVTQEVVKENTVEVIQEEITRDIHVDHYYTHLQPIKAVEVLPAQHFVVDEQTGKKVEIPAPEGWTISPSLQPQNPDTSNVVATTRHYVVDEEHPEGALEPPPALTIRKRPSQEAHRASKSGSATKWSPFPKVS